MRERRCRGGCQNSERVNARLERKSSACASEKIEVREGVRQEFLILFFLSFCFSTTELSEMMTDRAGEVFLHLHPCSSARDIKTRYEASTCSIFPKREREKRKDCAAEFSLVLYNYCF